MVILETRLAMIAVGLVVALAMGYHSLRLMGVMQRGLLEKSWRYLAYGSFLVAVRIAVLGLSRRRCEP